MTNTLPPLHFTLSVTVRSTHHELIRPLGRYILDAEVYEFSMDRWMDVNNDGWLMTITSTWANNLHNAIDSLFSTITQAQHQKIDLDLELTARAAEQLEPVQRFLVEHFTQGFRYSLEPGEEADSYCLAVSGKGTAPWPDLSKIISESAKEIGSD
jgi:hypothetical protein